MKLSIIVVTFDMARELPRTLDSLKRSYQIDADELDYEVLVIDNGSPEPVAEEVITSCGPNFHYHLLVDPPASPAYALNFGASKADGDFLCLMVDGAHLLTPGLLSKALACFRINQNSVVITRYFYLGPGEQNETILKGYNKQVEDKLLESINWPNDGYRLFEIGVPQILKELPNYNWFFRPIESNCLFMMKKNYFAIGGAEERFDIAGGGFMNIDLFKRAIDFDSSHPVMLIGEGSFHQIHGGTTTNVHPEEQTRRVETYKQQYREIRGSDLQPTVKDLYYYGNMPTPASKIQRLNRKMGIK
ncbi:MAG: glycosyltransferase family A protein [Haliea sp.]